MLFEGKGAALAELLSSCVGEGGLAYVCFQYLLKLFDLFGGGLFADEIVVQELDIPIFGKEGVEVPAIGGVPVEFLLSHGGCYARDKFPEGGFEHHHLFIVEDDAG